jgi:hypothetical protein
MDWLEHVLELLPMVEKLGIGQAQTVQEAAI